MRVKPCCIIRIFSGLSLWKTAVWRKMKCYFCLSQEKVNRRLGKMLQVIISIQTFSTMFSKVRISENLFQGLNRMLSLIPPILQPFRKKIYFIQSFVAFAPQMLEYMIMRRFFTFSMSLQVMLEARVV